MLKPILFCLLCLLLITPLCHAGLVGYWPFNTDDIAGDRVIDRSGKGHGGVLSGAVQADGKTGEALKFDGAGSCVNIDGINIEGPELSVSLWIKKDVIGGVRRLIYFSGLLQFGFSDRNIFVHTAAGLGEDTNLPFSDTGISAGQWYHLAVTWNTVAPSDNVKVYLDGDLKFQETLSSANDGDLRITGLTIGNDKSSSGRGFDGLIDEVAVYDNALTDEEVKKLYKGEVVRVERHGGPTATDTEAAVKPLGDAAALSSPAEEKKQIDGKNYAAGKKLLRVASELCSRLLGAPSVSEADLPAKVKTWQQTGLDGMVFSMASHDKSKGETNMTGQWWNLVPLRYEEFIPEINAFQSVKDWGRLTDNFLWSSMAIWGEGNCEAMDWFNDKHWEIILANVRLHARVARESGFKGILLDTEQYDQHGHGPWRYQFNYQYYAEEGYKLGNEDKPRPFEEIAGKVRERAKEYAKAVCSEFSGVKLIVIPGIYDWTLRLGAGPLEKNVEGLRPAFCDGLLLGLDKQASIITGTESTYNRTLYRDMLEVRNKWESSLEMNNVPEPARKQVSFAAGVMADAESRWSDTDVSVNKRNPEAHKHAVHNALAVSDEYAWLYGEQSKFLTAGPTPLMLEYFQANIEAHQPQDISWRPERRRK